MFESRVTGLLMPLYDGPLLIVGQGRVDTPEDQREGHRRLGEWWRWKQYHARFDRCCHGKSRAL